MALSVLMRVHENGTRGYVITKPRVPFECTTAILTIRMIILVTRFSIKILLHIWCAISSPELFVYRPCTAIKHL